MDYLNGAKALKLLSKVIGSLLVAYGVIVGLMGIGFEGRLSPVWRLLGVFVLLQGALYWVPNAKLAERRSRVVAYVAATCLPALLLTVGGLVTVWAEGAASFGMQGGFWLLAVLIPVSLCAPVSLCCHLKGSRT